MLPEYYWLSLESIRQSCQVFANPDRKTWIRFKYSGNGFDTIERGWTPPSLENAPGYYTLMCAETGQILNYTERFKSMDTRPYFSDSVFIGQFRFDRTILLRHKDGTPGRYSIGHGGIGERELTPELAKYVIKTCQEARAPVPTIRSLEEMEFPVPELTVTIPYHKI